jgi:hypothetical protein
VTDANHLQVANGDAKKEKLLAETQVFSRKRHPQLSLTPPEKKL